MPSQTSTQKKLLTSKTTESNWLVVSNLPEMSTEETIKEYFERYGHIQSIKIDKQHFAYIAFLDRHIASKAHYAENILNQQKLQTEFYNDSNLISKIFKETSPILTKSMHKHRTKHLSSPKYSHEENTRHQVVPIKDDSNQRMNNPKINQMKSSQQIYENASSSSASSEESHNDSMSHKDHVSELKRASLKTKILKISHLPSNISNQLLRDKLRNIFNDFQKPSHLLTIKIIDNYALLTFKNSDDINQALVFIKTQSINGDRLKAEPYHISITEKSEYNSMKRSLSSDIDIDEYSIKATRTLYIGNLPLDTSSNQLREKYSVYGEIIEIDVKRQEFQRPYAFIQYTDIKSVVKVLKSKLIHDHSIKLGFGKSQPTNILWLDNLPSNTTELALHTFLNQQTNISSDQIVHIYIDNRNSEKTDVAQCLIYFSDTNSAQNAIDLIRGKMFDTKRIQVDFSSRIFLKKFSDLIQPTDQNKSSNDQLVRRYSKVSDTTNSSIITQNFDSHHLSSSSSSPCLIKSDQDKHANTSRIFDWLMQSDHTDRNNNHEKEEQIVEHKKTFLHTKIIPLQTNGLFIQSDIRLKIYSNDQYQQSIHSLRFLLPEFAKNLRKNSNVINPNAHFKFLFNNKSTHSNSVDYNSISATTATQPTIPPLTSIPSSLSNAISTKTSSNISSINFKHKLIPPPLSVIRTMSSSIDRNDASVCPTPKSITFINDIENQKHSLSSVTFSPISQKPQALKSILKPSSNLSSSKSNEIRKEVRIISTDSSSNTKINQKLPSNDQQKLKNPINKSQTLTKRLVNSNLTITTKISKETVKRPLPMTTKTSQPLNKILKSNSTSSLKSIQQSKTISFKKTTVSNTVKSNSKTFKQASKPQTNTCMYDRIKERARKEQIRNSLLSVKTKVTNGNTQPIKIKQHPLGLENGQPINEPIIFDSEIFDTGENDDKKSCQQPIKISKFNKKNFILKKKLKTKNRAEKRPSMDESNRSSKRVKLQLTNNDEEHLIKSEICPNEISKTDDQQTISSNNNHEMIKLDESIDIKPILSQTTNQNQEDADNKQLLQNELASSQDLLDRSTSQSIKNEPFERILNISNASNDHHLLVTDNSLPVSSSDLTKPSTPSSLTTKTSLNLMNSQSITTHKHPPTSSHLLSQTLTPDNNLLSPYPHQHFSYSFFVPPDSPPSSTRTLSTSSCSSLITTPFHNSMISGQQNCHNKDSRRDSLTKFSGSSTPYFGTSLGSPSVFFNPTELYAYPTTNQQIINSCPIDFYRMNDIHSIDPFDIHWEGYIMLKTDQAYIKTQLVAGNSQIARLTINYWNTDLNDNLRISQRMRLEELQLNGVKKHMQMTNDHCILIAEPNGLTPDEILLEKNHLKNGVIQYLNEKKAAGILNILLPGVLQPVYVVHIFPPCQFASEILQERAPDAYRCVVQNKTEQIYLLFVITSTFE